MAVICRCKIRHLWPEIQIILDFERQKQHIKSSENYNIMAHDFGIRNKTKQSKWSFFFGYAQGLMYKVFNAWEHCGFLSGDNEVLEKSKEVTVKSLDRAIKEFDQMNYPDPLRMDDIKEFRKAMDKDGENDVYEIWYS